MAAAINFIFMFLTAKTHQGRQNIRKIFDKLSMKIFPIILNIAGSSKN
jgi:hypothetical protein